MKNNTFPLNSHISIDLFNQIKLTANLFIKIYFVDPILKFNCC